MSRTRLLLSIFVLLPALPMIHAQESPAEPNPGPRVAPLQQPAAAQPTPAASSPRMDAAWSLLKEKLGASKPAAERIQALAALSSMGADPHAADLIATAIVEHDMDVRTAAVLAAGKTRNPQLLPTLRKALDDDKPQVAYAAAVTLWRMHDTSGEDLLRAVADGDRKAKPGLIASEKHKAAKEMRSPSALAKIGVDQVSGMFLGPFGYGVKAIELAHQNGGDPARGEAIELLSQHHTEATREAIVDALNDKDAAVRASAARALGAWPGPGTAEILMSHLNDDKLAVRLSAAAGYIRALDPHPAPPESGGETPVASAPENNPLAHPAETAAPRVGEPQ